MGSNVQWNQDTSQEFFDRASIAAKLQNTVPNNIIYVDASNPAASSSNDGLTRKSPMATLAQGLGKTVSSKGDVVVLLPGHTETLATTTAGVTISQSGVIILGLGNGRNRPAITCGAADIVGVLLSGSNNLIRNVRFVGSTSQTTASSVILSVTGTDNVIDDCVFEHGGAGPLQACRMTAATRTVWRNCTWLGTAAGPDVAIAVMSTSRNCRFENLVFNYAGSSGLDSAAIWTSTTADCGGSVYDRLYGISMDLTLLDLNSSQGAKGDSLLINSALVSNAAITLANSLDLGGCVAAGCWLSDNYLTAAVATGAIGAITTVSQRIPSGSPCT